MMQLWLKGKRIDSIVMLREMFSTEDVIAQHQLCAELLAKVAAGIFIPWLERCHEARLRKSPNERAQDEAQGILDLEKCYLDLTKEQDLTSLSDVGEEALAKICNVDSILFQTTSTLKLKQDIPIKSKLHELLKGQDWYQTDANVRKSIEAIPPEFIAVDSDSLARVVTTARNLHGCTATDVYLLSIGRPFVVRNLNALRNLRLVGYGYPVLSFLPQYRGTEIDMVERNLKFVRLKVDDQGVVLRGKEENCIAR